MENSCATCGAKGVEPKCSLCKEVFYCNKKCQAKHWKSHKYSCKGHSPPRSVNDFEFLEVLGNGNFSEIIHVQERRTGKHFALKRVNKNRVVQLRKQADVFMEKHALMRLKDVEGVVKLHECFKDDTELYFLSERVRGGEVWEKCKLFGIREEEARFYFRQVCFTLKTVHSRGIIHRDIKTENVMLTESGQTKLIDFGSAKDTQHPEVEVPGNSMRNKKFENFVGTPHFMAPECINNKESTVKSDIWSLGCMLYFMVAGYPPFQGASDYLIFTKVLNLDYSFPRHFSQETKDFIEGVLKLDPTERPTIDQVCESEYISESPSTFPLASLFWTSLVTLRSKITAEHTDYSQDIEDIFRAVDTPHTQHTKERLKYCFSKSEVSSQQGV